MRYKDKISIINTDTEDYFLMNELEIVSFFFFFNEKFWKIVPRLEITQRIKEKNFRQESSLGKVNKPILNLEKKIVKMLFFFVKIKLNCIHYSFFSLCIFYLYDSFKELSSNVIFY